jgi:hypothetical protein
VRAAVEQPDAADEAGASVGASQLIRGVLRAPERVAGAMMTGIAGPERTACPTCGAVLFTPRSGTTTPDEIRAFAIGSKLKAREEIARDGWIHPGQYCPNGCYTVLWNLKRVDLGAIARESERRLREDTRAPVLVQPDDDGWISCPGCGVQWTLRDRRFGQGPGSWQHGCGLKVIADSGPSGTAGSSRRE